MEFKIGVLADVLGTQPDELAKSHNLQNTDEVIPDERVTEILKTELENVRKAVHSAAKKEGHGWGSREAMQTVEKSLATEFGLKSSGLNEMVTELKQRMESKVDDKAQMQLETLKEKIKLKDKEFEDFKKGLEQEKRLGVIDGTIRKALKKTFDTTNERLTDLGVKDFLGRYDVDVDGDTMQIYTKDGKAVFKSADDVLKEYFDDILPPIQVNKDQHPKVPNAKPVTANSFSGSSVEELTQSLHKAKLPEERAAILKKIKELSN